MVIGIIGRMGSGKTLNMTKWGLLFQELTKLPAFFNYHVKGGHFYERLNDVITRQNAIICCDEITTELDSRSWESGKSVKTSHKIVQIRKLNINLLYTTQRWNTVEKRLRENTDYLIMCKEKGKIERIIDVQDGEEMATEVITLINEHPELIWNKYDTNEIIDPSKYGKY